MMTGTPAGQSQQRLVIGEYDFCPEGLPLEIYAKWAVCEYDAVFATKAEIAQQPRPSA